MSRFLDDVPEGTPGHGDEFDREASAANRDRSGNADADADADADARSRWLIADPDLPRDEAAAALRDALTWPRADGAAGPAVAGLAAVAGGLLGIAAAVWLFDLVEWPSWAALGAVGAAAVGIPVWAATERRANGRARARQQVATATARESLVEVPASFATWAESDGRSLAHDDLVALARALSATRAAAATLDAWRWGEPEIDWPHAHAVVDPVLVAEHEAARAALDVLAGPLGYEVPAEVVHESLR